MYRADALSGFRPHRCVPHRRAERQERLFQSLVLIGQRAREARLGGVFFATRAALDREAGAFRRLADDEVERFAGANSRALTTFARTFC